MLINSKQEIFLVNPRYVDLWVMPGGKIENGESAVDATKREVLEEANIEVKDLRKLGVHLNTREGKQDTVTTFITKEWIDNGRKWNWEIKSSGFFHINKLPINTSLGTRNRLDEYLEDSNKEYTGRWS